MNQRKDIIGGVNLEHSQATIIMLGAAQMYKSEYGKGGWENNPNAINSTQRIVAVGPAVLKEDWANAVKDLGLTFDPKNDYRHDPRDPVRYGTAPSNSINQVANLLGVPNYNSPIYIPNLLEPIYAVGLVVSDGLNAATNGYLYKAINKDLPNIEYHDVTNPFYQQPLAQ